MIEAFAMEKFYDFMVKYSNKLKEIEDAQSIKLNTLIAGSLKQLEKSIAEQQAAVMAVEGLEKKRLALQEELGLAGMNFKEILSVSETPWKEKLEELFDQITVSVVHIKYANEKAMSLAKGLIGLSDHRSTTGYQDGVLSAQSSSGSYLQAKI